MQQNGNMVQPKHHTQHPQRKIGNQAYRPPLQERSSQQEIKAENTPKVSTTESLQPFLINRNLAAQASLAKNESKTERERDGNYTEDIPTSEDQFVQYSKGVDDQGLARVTNPAGNIIQRADAMVTVGVDYSLLTATDLGILANTEKIAGNYKVKPFDIFDSNLDLGHVKITDKLIIQGHGNSTAMTYNADYMAKLLASRNLKEVGELICLGCFTGGGFANSLATKLSVLHSVKVGTHEAPGNLMAPTGSGVPQTLTDDAQRKWDALESKLQEKELFFGANSQEYKDVKLQMDAFRRDPLNFQQIGTGGAWKKGRPDLIDFN
jgi:hypothetical protein